MIYKNLYKIQKNTEKNIIMKKKARKKSFLRKKARKI